MLVELEDYLYPQLQQYGTKIIYINYFIINY